MGHLADSESYYMLDFNVYTGKDAGADNTVPLGTRVVTKLVESLYKRRHHVYMDNYFTSVGLFEHLQRKKTYATGTVRKDRRGLPVGIKTLAFKNSGQMKKWQKGGRLMAVGWQEKKRQVNVLTSGSKTGNMQLRRPGKRGQPEQVYPKPVTIQDYTENFNAVDKIDQLRSYYGNAARANKWWKYVFWFLLDVTMINAYILQKSRPAGLIGPVRRPMDHKTFHVMVARGLTAGFSSRKRRPTVEPPQMANIRSPTRHVPTKINTARGIRNCVLCDREGRRTAAGNKVQSSFECVPCGVALCKNAGCFASFHGYQQ